MKSIKLGSIAFTVIFMLISNRCSRGVEGDIPADNSLSGPVPGEGVFLPPGEGRVIQLTPDEKFTVKAGRGETADRFEFLELEVKKNGGPVEHVHKRQGEAFYVVSGKFRVKMAGRLVDAPPRSFVFIPQGVAHAFVNVGNETGTLLIVGSPVGFESYFNEIGDALRKMPPGPPDIKAVAPILEKYHIEIVGPPLIK